MGVRPDVVILDCRLPDGDGLTLVHQWRDQVMGGVPVIVVTGHGERQDIVPPFSRVRTSW